jgi:hypothetical protein
MQQSFNSLAKSVFRFVLFGCLLLCTACASITPAASIVPLRVQYSFTTQPWLAKLNSCAGKTVLKIELRAVSFQDPKSADLVLRFGQTGNLTTLAYQIGTDDLLVIVNHQNPVGELSALQVRALFTGKIQTWNSIQGIDAPVRVWVYPQGEDVQQVFEHSFLASSPVTSLAKLANSPEEMSQAVSTDPDAIGIITRGWKTQVTTDVFTVAHTLPILAITNSELDSDLAQMLACLQK